MDGPVFRARARAPWWAAVALMAVFGLAAPWADATEADRSPTPSRAGGSYAGGAGTPQPGDGQAEHADHDHDLTELSAGERAALARWERTRRRLGRARSAAQAAATSWREARAAAQVAHAALKEAQSRILMAQARERTLTMEVAARLEELHAIGARLYMHSGGSDLDLPVVADAGDPSDRSRRAVYAGSASDTLSDKLALLARRQRELDALRRTLAAQQAGAARLDARRATELERAEAARRRAETTQRVAQAEARVARRTLRSIRSQRAQLETETVAITQRSNAITLLLAARQANQVRAGSFRLRRPVPGVVTSGFGYRVHPILRTRRWHMGIDMRAATGTPVRAGAAGVVAFAGVRTGYGNTVIIDHGNQFATLYGHLSALSVRTGDAVGRGAEVGRAGSTGMSTGPHLHFEVRILGLPHNPVDYL